MKRYDPERHHRRSIRLAGYDYTGQGAYFVTLCTHEREPLFGQVVAGEMVLNEWGAIVQQCWQAIPHHFLHTRLDEFVVMPNHVHGIIWIVDDVGVGASSSGVPGASGMGEMVGATHASPLPGVGRTASDAPCGPKRGSIGAIVGSFKSAVTKRINEARGTPGAPLWQRNYYEHIIRNDRALALIRRYIRENPQRWHLDRYNPDADSSDPVARVLMRLLGKPLEGAFGE